MSRATIPRYLLLATLVARCDSRTPNPPMTTPQRASPAAAAPAGLPREGCEVTGPAPPGPVTDPNGPYFHRVVVARTRDGVTLADAREVLDHASVPDGVRMPDGTLRIYYVNGADGALWVARMDGQTVTPIGPIRVDGVERPAGVVDPDALALPDGRIRLFYLSGFGPPGSASARAMCVAESADGERFSVVGRAIRFSADLTTDPSVAPLPDGSWLMAASRGQQTVLARSRDGLAFEQGETLGYGGVPELAALAGGLRLYVCARGIESYVSANGGRSWQREATVVSPGPGRRIVCDPSSVAGTDVFIYKTAP